MQIELHEAVGVWCDRHEDQWDKGQSLLLDPSCLCIEQAREHEDVWIRVRKPYVFYARREFGYYIWESYEDICALIANARRDNDG